MSEKKLEMGNLDEEQLEALREQLKAAIGGQREDLPEFGTNGHTSHNDTDGWA
jgi:hypothetical protein